MTTAGTGGRDASPTARQLQAFCAAYDACADSGAPYADGARALGVRPATIFRLVDKLARIAGLPGGDRLFLRSGTGGGMIPSETARAMREPAGKLLAAYRLFEAASGEANHRLPLRVAAYPAHAVHFLAGAVAAFEADDQSHVQILELVDERRAQSGRTLFEDLRHGRVDVVVAPQSDAVDGLIAVPLYQWRLVAIEFDPKPEAGTTMPIGALQDQPVLAAPAGYSSHELLESAARVAGFEMTFGPTSTNVPALLALGHAGLGVPVVPSDSFDKHDLSRFVDEGRLPRPMPIIDRSGRELSGMFAAWRRATGGAVTRSTAERLVHRLREATEPSEFGTASEGV